MSSIGSLAPKVDEALVRGEGWVRSKQSGDCWRVPVVSESSRATALFLLIATGRQQEAAIDYLIGTRVWEQSVSDSAALVRCLLARREVNLAREVSTKALRSRVKRGGGDLALDDRDAVEWVLRKGLSWLNPRGSDLLQKLFIKSLLKSTVPYYWADRCSQVYSFVPLFLASLTEDKGYGSKVRDVLRLTQNSDGSFGGIAVATIIGSYMLEALGDDQGARRAANWMQQLQNQDGSVRPILYQDVYDTAWGSTYFGEASAVDKSISWLDKTKIAQLGYPYLSYGFCPDSDDTALVLLAKQSARIPIEDKTVEFLVDGQNPDGGWGFVSPWTFRSSLPYLSLAKHSSIVRRAVKRLGGRAFWSSSFESTVDMTSRVMISLAGEKESEERRRAKTLGIRYLRGQNESRLFHAPIRWTDSDAFETSLAVIAMSLNNSCDGRTSQAIDGLLRMHLSGADAAAHVLWASNSARVPTEKWLHLVKYLLASQNEDGSWSPTLKFKADSYYLDPFFSTILPMIALKKAVSKAD